MHAKDGGAFDLAFALLAQEPLCHPNIHSLSLLLAPVNSLGEGTRRRAVHVPNFTKVMCDIIPKIILPRILSPCRISWGETLRKLSFESG